jgi:hypothetical protein
MIKIHMNAKSFNANLFKHKINEVQWLSLSDWNTNIELQQYPCNKKKNAIHLTLSLKKTTVTYYYLYVCQTIDQGRVDLEIGNMCQLLLCHNSK